MSLLARVTDFLPGTEIQSQPFDDEFNQLVNLLSGVSQNKSIRILSNDNSFAVARFDQRGTNDILELFADGAEVVRFEKSGKLVTTHPDVNTGFNADKVDGFDLAGNKVAFSHPFYYASIPGAVETAQSTPDFIVPTGSAITITKIRVIFHGTHTAGGVLTWTVKRRNAAGALQTDIGTITVNNTNGTPDQVYENNVTDVPLNDSDTIFVLLTTRTAPISEAQATVSVVGVQSFTS